MPETQTKSEILPHKKTIKLTPAIGDWTTYKPPKVYAKRIKSGLYGFDRLSEERLHQALLIHYNFTRDLLNLLHINLMLGADFYSVSGEQTNYLSFLRAASHPLVDFKILLPDWHGSISVCMDLSLANTIINQSLGCRDLAPLSRKLTPAEESILAVTIKDFFVPMLANAFKNIFGGTSLSALNSPDVSTDSSVNPSSSYVHFTIDISLADNPPAKIQIGYTGNLLKSLLKKLEELPDNKPVVLGKLPPALLNSIEVPVSVTLGTTALGTGDLRNMEEGDVVSLDDSLQSPVSIHLGKKIQILGQPGKTDKKYASRIISFEKEEKIKLEAMATLGEDEETEEFASEKLEEEPKEEYSKEGLKTKSQPIAQSMQEKEEENLETEEQLEEELTEEEVEQELDEEDLEEGFSEEELEEEEEEDFEEETLEDNEENSAKGW